MANKEQKHFKRFPKRLLSSFRKGRKFGQHVGKQDTESEVGDKLGFTKYDLETAQNENAIIDLEATIILDSPGKNTKSDASVETSVTPKRLLGFQNEEATDDHSNLSTPQPQRLVLGHVMSASADSGIDCSILMSEKNSPEHFVAFTRREAERLRQEQLHNGSVLETLSEIDRSPGEELENVMEATGTVNDITMCDNDLEGAVGGYDMNESVVQHCDLSEKTLNTSDNCDNILGSNNVLTEGATQNSRSSDGDYVLLTENSDAAMCPLVDAAEIIANSKKHAAEISRSETGNNTDIANQSVHDDSLAIGLGNEPSFNNEANVHELVSENIDVTGSYMNFYANRTDEIKSAEARMRQGSSTSTRGAMNLEVTNNIVSPIPVLSSSIATHRVLQSTPSPARLYINENSAFAKCKSLKRSVSDVGKGILGKLRNLSKDDSESKYEYVCGRPEVQEHSKHSRLIKKFGGWKERRSFKVKVNEGKIKKRARHKSEQTGDFVEDSDDIQEFGDNTECSWDFVSSNLSLKNDIAFERDQGVTEKTFDVTESKHRPFYQEILSDDVKQELEASFQRRQSPVTVDSIHDLTACISEMTTALCASSAESIACICDCKNRNSNIECCEKRKTPSPVSKNDCVEKIVSPDLLCSLGDTRDGSHPNPNLDCSQTESRNSPETKVLSGYSVSTIENEITEYSPSSRSNILNNETKQVNTVRLKEPAFPFETEDTSDESTDENDYYMDDNDNSSSDECSDVDCSKLCNVSPNTGNVEYLSSSSDSECSLNDSFDINPITRKHEKQHSDPTHECCSSSESSETCTNCDENRGSPNQGDSSFNIGDSPYSVRFREIDFENGDVMYLSNNLNEDFENCWIDDSKTSLDSSAVCVTPVSSPRVCDDLPLCSDSYHVNHSGDSVSDSSQNAQLGEETVCNVREVSEACMDRSRSEIDTNVTGCDQVQLQESSLPLKSDFSPTPLNLSQDSSFTNVSFEGSFADASFSVSGNSGKCTSRNSSVTNRNTYVYKNLRKSQSKLSLHSECDSFNPSQNINRPLSFSELNDSRFMYRCDQFDPNVRLSRQNKSSILERTLLRNHNRSLNESGLMDNVSRSFSHSVNELGTGNLCGANLNKSWTFSYHEDCTINTEDVQNLSRHATSPLSSPLDLSISKGKRSSYNDLQRKSDNDWVQRHLGQVYSPAKRVLHKNSGLSESDLCKQILDIYVSDADESGFDQTFTDISFNTSVNASADHSTLSAYNENSLNADLDDSDSREEPESLMFGTYVAPRHVVKETNVDDFTTTTVYTCYTGEAKTRKLPGNPNSSTLEDGIHRCELDEPQNFKENYQVSKKRNRVTGQGSDMKERGQRLSGREALRDRTNTVHRLSSLPLPEGLDSSIEAGGVEQEMREEKQRSSKMTDRSFDRLTMLHTAHNGQRKVRCLSMDESQNIVKYYPPPKEASRVSWGQTISELDLYRHTPRKTPVKTRPILNQKENNYPYEDDSPSPIVLTKMRKPKSLAKRYKNWPWS